MTSEKTYDEKIIDENDHDLQISSKGNENSIPKSVVKLEDLYDIKDRFKKVTNAKLQSSTLKFELVNLGSDSKPQNINLGINLTPEERAAFIKLLSRYKNVLLGIMRI